jgi:hypothetical protein
MNSQRLREEIEIELELMESTVHELLALQHDVTGREPAGREKAAAAAFLAQFYTGLENILKRISRFYAVALPVGDTWHVDLFVRFCFPPHDPLPVLFDESIAMAIAPFRKFRHVVYHSYGFELDWVRMTEGISNVESIFSQIRSNLLAYLQVLRSLD